MALSEHIDWYLDCQTYGGVLHERLLAALVRGEGIWAGLIFSFTTAGHPSVEYWERITDLERGGFARIPEHKARAICDVLPRFLERLEQAAAQGQGDTGKKKDQG